MAAWETFDSLVVRKGRAEAVQRCVILEEPLAIRIGDTPFIILMCTPGLEVELALGFLVTEGFVRSIDELDAVTFCPQSNRNVVRVIPAPGGRLANMSPDQYPHRRVFSSCGACGTETLDEWVRDVQPLTEPSPRPDPLKILALADAMTDRQFLFPKTGGTHAAVLAKMPLTNESIAHAVVCEDLGRHNALDKAIGSALKSGYTPGEMFCFLSGRISWEMAAKAARAGITHLASVSAPTASAVRLARRLNLFLAGFVRNDSFTLYTHLEHLTN